MLEKLALEAAGSPQLMQYLCLTSCHVIRRNGSQHLADDDDILAAICKQTVPAADFGSVVEKMRDGPKTRGSVRKIHITKWGWQGDVYKLLAKALSLNPPQLNFRYNSLMERISSVCVGDAPSGSSTTSACYHAAALVNDAVNSTIVEWDSENDVFDIRDPYFLFYLRWSGIVDEPEQAGGEAEVGAEAT